MKKYFLKSNGQELKVGQKIELSVPVETSYGAGVATTKVDVTEEVLTKLVADGFASEVDTQRELLKKAIDKITPSLNTLVSKVDFDTEDGYLLCALLSDLSPMAYLTILIESMALTKNQGKTKDNKVWWLNPAAGFKPTIISTNNPFVNKGPVFYNQVDAIEAANILQPFIGEFFNEE